LVLSGIYELPFGKGRMFANNGNAFVDRVIGGWQISGIYNWQSGAPLNFGNIIFNGDVNQIKLPVEQRSVARWFNTGAGFERSAALQLANNVRTFPLRFGFLRSQAINNYDLSVIKNTRVRESINAQFKAEFLNAMNHPLLPAPNTTPSVAAFGTIAASTQANYPRRIQLTIKVIF
jgi:hypothetical protein